MGGATRKYVEEQSFGNATLCRGHLYNPRQQMYKFVQKCVQQLCSQFVYGGVNEQRHCTHVHQSTLVYDCARFLHSFVRWQRQGAGCGASTPTCNLPAADDSVHFYYERLALVGGDVTGPRRPGWMRLQTRPLGVGGNLPKHWRDGQSVIRPLRGSLGSKK